MSRDYRNRACRFSLVLIIASLMLAGCHDPDLLVIRDQYWKAADFNDEIEQKIQIAVEGYGNKVGYLDILFPADPAGVTASIIEENPAIVVLSPLFSQLSIEVASQAGDRQIVAFLLGAGDVENTENLTRVSADRQPAYKLSGNLCRQYLLTPGNETKGVAGLFYSGGSVRSSERRAFAAGLGKGLDNRITLKTFPRLDGVGEVNDHLSGLAESNIGVFFVSMSGLNREVISSIVTRSPSLIVTERIGGEYGTDIPYADRILATVEEDWIGVFEEDLSRAGSEIGIDTILLPGPAAFSHEASWVGGFFSGSERE